MEDRVVYVKDVLPDIPIELSSEEYCEVLSYKDHFAGEDFVIHLIHSYDDYNYQRHLSDNISSYMPYPLFSESFSCLINDKSSETLLDILNRIYKSYVSKDKKNREANCPKSKNPDGVGETTGV